MAEFEIKYHAQYCKELKSPHQLKPFGNPPNWGQWLTKTLRFKELVFTGDSDNITLYFLPENGQINWIGENGDTKEVSTPMYISFSGDGDYEKGARFLLLNFLEKNTHYSEGEFSLGIFSTVGSTLKELDDGDDKKQAITIGMKRTLKNFIFEKLDENDWGIKDVKVIGKSNYNNQQKTEEAKARLAMLLEATEAKDVPHLVELLKTSKKAQEAWCIIGMLVGNNAAWEQGQAWFYNDENPELK